MKKKYEIKFEPLDLMEGESYIGVIERWQIREDSQGAKLQIYVKLYIAEESSFLYSCRVTNKRNTRFYNLCRKLYLLEEDGTVNFEILDTDCDVVVTLSEMPDGNFLISSMEWLDEEEEDEDE